MDAYLYRYAIYKAWKLTDRLLDELADYFNLTVGDVVEAIELVEDDGVEKHPYGTARHWWFTVLGRMARPRRSKTISHDTSWRVRR